MIKSKPNQLSKRECKYRNKIIAENHLKKSDQKILDDYINNWLQKSLRTTYRSLYYDKMELFYTIPGVGMTPQNINKLISAFEKFGDGVRNANGSFKSIIECLNGVAERWRDFEF